MGSLVGTSLERYDFFLYGTASALVFDKLFFPNLDPLVGTLLAFATYAIGFIARPLGGLGFGHFGDRVGRKQVLVVTLLIMGTATFLIGALPTYQAIGVAAPILLVVLWTVRRTNVESVVRWSRELQPHLHQVSLYRTVVQIPAVVTKRWYREASQWCRRADDDRCTRFGCGDPGSSLSRIWPYWSSPSPRWAVARL